MIVRSYRTAVLGGSLFLLAACGSGGEDLAFEPGDRDVTDVNLALCEDLVDDTMRLHGYPRRPNAETPQADFRRAHLVDCMRRHGFEPD